MESRNFERKPVRTATSVVVVGEDGEKTYKAWSNDISPGGMRIVSCERIEGKDVRLSILLPGLAEQMVHGEIVNACETDHLKFRYSYGIRFLDISQKSAN